MRATMQQKRVDDRLCAVIYNYFRDAGLRALASQVEKTIGKPLASISKALKEDQKLKSRYADLLVSL